MIFGKQNLTHIKSETRRPGLLPPLWGLRFTRQRIKYKKTLNLIEVIPERLCSSSASC